MKPNRPPSEPYQFFDSGRIDRRTQALTMKLHNVNGGDLQRRAAGGEIGPAAAGTTRTTKITKHHERHENRDTKDTKLDHESRENEEPRNTRKTGTKHTKLRHENHAKTKTSRSFSWIRVFRGERLCLCALGAEIVGLCP